MSDQTLDAAAVRAVSHTPASRFRRRALGHTGFVFGATVLVIIFLVAIFAPWLAPHDPYDQVLDRKFIPPVWFDSPRATWDHILGTDMLGRDYLSRLLYGARISLFIGFSAMFISMVIGTTIGVIAGYFGGKVDAVCSFIITTRLSLPVVLVAIAVVSLVGSSLTVVVCVLGLLIWDQFAVVTRAATMQVCRREFVAASEALGTSRWRIVVGEILPNIMPSLIVVATIEMAHAILLEAALSFLGLGVQPPLPSWGLMISEGKGLKFFESWLITIPGAALIMLVHAINHLGDGLRDVTGPESRA